MTRLIMRDSFQDRRTQAGATLLEALVAILIFSVGILAVIGLQAASIASVTDAKYRVDASAVAEQQIGELWGTQATLSAGTTTTSLSALPGGSMTTTLTGSAADGWQATIGISWTPPNATTAHKFDTVARIYGS